MTPQQEKNLSVFVSLSSSLALMRGSKPNDRSEEDRRYAIAITDMEKVWAYFCTFIEDGTKLVTSIEDKQNND